jgi:cytoskeletal protein RodZ
VGLFITMFLSFKMLPHKPARYKHHRTFFMVIQWVLLPLTTIIYSAFAALNSQTRLIFGWYLGKFDVTEKAVVKDSGETVSSHS